MPIDSPDPVKSARPTGSWRAEGTRALDALAFSNGLPAAIAASLSVVSSRALGAEPVGRLALVAASGAFVIYGLDRLRDVERDWSTSPLRTEFVLRHRPALSIGLLFAALTLGVTLWRMPPRITGLCLAVGALGLLHRRLKGRAALKALYVSAAWVAICVGLPGLMVGFDVRAGWLASVLFLALSSNLMASNVREDESQWLRERPESVLRVARSLALLGIAVALVAPTELRGFAWIPVAQSLALLFFRPSEHYGEVAVDGALLVGALATRVHQSLL